MSQEQTPQISIIVPVYNVEPYIRKCLDSIKAQTFTDFEAIIVDDASPDNSINIAREFAEADPRFVILTRENGGLSAARNTGLDYATGKYIAFIDSDDFVAPNYLEVLYNACEDNGADMASCAFTYHYDSNGFRKKQLFIMKDCVLEHDEAVSMIIKDRSIHNYAWNKLYKRTLFTEHNIKYPTMYFEDVVTSARIIYYANKLAVSEKCLYYYVKRPGSILSTMNVKKINDFLHSVLIVCNFYMFNGEYEKYKKAIARMLRKFSFVNYYSITREHFVKFSFRGMLTNYKINRKAVKYIKSCEWEPIDGMPELPYKVKDPQCFKK